MSLVSLFLSLRSCLPTGWYEFFKPISGHYFLPIPPKNISHRFSAFRVYRKHGPEMNQYDTFHRSVSMRLNYNNFYHDMVINTLINPLSANPTKWSNTFWHRPHENKGFLIFSRRKKAKRKHWEMLRNFNKS